MPELLFLKLTVYLRSVMKETVVGEIITYSEKVTPSIEYQASIPERWGGGVGDWGNREE